MADSVEAKGSQKNSLQSSGEVYSTIQCGTFKKMSNDILFLLIISACF